MLLLERKAISHDVVYAESKIKQFADQLSMVLIGQLFYHISHVKSSFEDYLNIFLGLLFRHNYYLQYLHHL